MHGRIRFEGNPWPRGHAVRDLTFAGHLSEAGIGLLLHLKTEDYDADGAPHGDDEDADSWNAPVVWQNYGACTLSNSYWGIDPAKLPPLVPRGQSLRTLLSRAFRMTVDPLAPRSPDGLDHEANVFNIYLLGHDAVRGHDIAVRPAANGQYDIDWSGAIALAYVGRADYEYAFQAELRDVPFAGLMVDPAPVIFGKRGAPDDPGEAARTARIEALALTHLNGLNGVRIDHGDGVSPDWLRLEVAMT